MRIMPAYGYTLLSQMVLRYCWGRFVSPALKKHHEHNQQHQHHDVLTIKEGFQLIGHDWRDFVPHRHH